MSQIKAARPKSKGQWGSNLLGDIGAKPTPIDYTGALGYKLGQLKILELRARAREKPGVKFDLRAFHDEILDAAALPLDVLDARVTAWIAKQ